MSAGRLNHGGAAFPMPGADYTEDCGDFKRDAYHGPQEGMTLRDYFAAKAMASLVAGDGAQDICDHDSRYTGGNFAEWWRCAPTSSPTPC
jgi:hypothetical protein